MQQTTTLEAVLTRDRTIVLGGLAALTVLAWGYTIYLASDMMGIGMGAATITIGSDGVVMPQLQPWGTVDFVLMFAMWAVMMTAMMLPSGAPMILVFAKINRKRRDQQKPFIPTSVFLGGYLIVWGGFALAATLAFGVTPELAISSTDANLPISIGVPAITMSRGGDSGNSHSLNEWWENVDGHVGIQIGLVSLLAEAGLVQ